MSQFDEFAQIAEGLGWNVQSGDDYVEIGMMPTSYDFWVSLDAKPSDELFLEKAELELAHYIESYDTDYEAYIWIGEDGHGKNGAPYHIVDIVREMEDCLESVERLLYAVQDRMGGRDA